jgi:hypothetical protein
MNKHILIELPAPPPVGVPALFLQVSNTLSRRLILCNLAIDFEIQILVFQFVVHVSEGREGVADEESPERRTGSPRRRRFHLGCR